MIALIQQDQEFTTFRASCNWPDRPCGSVRPSTSSISRATRPAIGDDECPMAEKCVVTAIEEDVAVLASPDATDQEKLAALKFLGHWVGDIHQPLHAWFRGRQGRKRRRTQGSFLREPPCSLGSLPSRGAAWHGADRDRGRIRASITDEQRAEWLASDAVAWANEFVRDRASPTSAIASSSVTPASTKPTTAS